MQIPTIRTVYVKNSLTSGENALNSIDGNILNNGDLAFVYTEGAKYEYFLDATSGVPQQVPSVITPANNAGDKRWLLQNQQTLPLLTTSTDLSLEAKHNTILVDAAGGDITLSLPPSADIAGRLYTIKKVDSSSNQVIIQPNGTELLEDSTNKILTKKGAGLVIQSDGTNWKVVNFIPAINVTPSENLQWSNDVERSTTSLFWVKKKEIKLNQDIAALRVKFEIQTYYTYGQVYGQVYINGSPVGIQRSASTTRVVVSQDFYNFHAGDLLQVYITVDNESVPGMVRKFRLYWSEAIEAFGDCNLGTPLETTKSWDVDPTNQDP